MSRLLVPTRQLFQSACRNAIYQGLGAKLYPLRVPQAYAPRLLELTGRPGITTILSVRHASSALAKKDIPAGHSVSSNECEPTEGFLKVEDFTAGAGQRKTFSDYATIAKPTQKALEQVFKIQHPSIVQHTVLSVLPTKEDMIIKAKTGTGKTLAFLIPAIESLLAKYATYDEPHKAGRNIGILVVSPTRELAKQISEEAAKLTSFHKWGVQTIVGGEPAARQTTSLKKYRCDIVVGTPGRILDFFTNNEIFQQKAKGIGAVILDEADELLDMGFKDEIDQIISACPKQRQTLLVSATFDERVKAVARTALNKEHLFLDCVSKDDVNTNKNTVQEYVRAEYHQHYPALYDIITKATAKAHQATGKGTKIIVFCPTTKTTEVYYQAIHNMFETVHDVRDFAKYMRRAKNRGDFNPIMVFRLHGKMSQYQRSTVTRRFREYKTSRGQTAILVTSDVSARGVDYPNVSTVVQVGIPSDPAHYIHRVGRTGRAGKQGYAISLLSSAEIEFLKHLPGVPIKESADLTPDNLGLIEESEDYQNKWKEARKSINPELLNEAFVALLGFYVGRDSYINATGQDLLKMVSGLTKPFDLPTPHIPATLRSMLRLDQGANSSRYRRPTQPFFKSHNNRGSSNNSWSRNDRGKRYSRRDGGNRPKQGY